MESDISNIQNIVKIIAKKELINKVRKTHSFKEYTQSIIDSVAEDFSLKLSNRCFEATKEFFETNNTQAIYEKIKQVATDSTTLDQFLELLKAHTAHVPSGSSASTNRASDPKPTTTKDDVRRKYKELILKYHPDKIKKKEGETEESFNQRKEVCARKIYKLIEAYKKLS